MEETIIPACDVFRPEITIKSSPIELCWNFTTFKKNIKFGVYRSLESPTNNIDSNKKISISYNALNEKQRDKKESSSQTTSQTDYKDISNTSVIANESVISNSNLDVSNPAAYTRRKSNFNDYNLEVVKKLDYYESSKSVIKGSCVLDKAGTYVLVFDNSINRNTSNRLTFLYFTRQFNLLPEISSNDDLGKQNENKSEIIF